MGVITFSKVRESFGWLSNLAPYPIPYRGQLWPTAEALYQALRFDDPAIREKIRVQRSPMAALYVATNSDYAPARLYLPHTERDIDAMRTVLRIKFTHYPKLRQSLMATDPHDIVKPCHARGDTFWGARLIQGEWWGDNVLGSLLMELRDELILEDQESDGKKIPK